MLFQLPPNMKKDLERLSAFLGRLPKDRAVNRPFFEAIDGLAACYDALEKADEADVLRRLATRLSRGGNPDRPGGPE